jgi:hypothetical protein
MLALHSLQLVVLVFFRTLFDPSSKMMTSQAF